AGAAAWARGHLPGSRPSETPHVEDATLRPDARGPAVTPQSVVNRRAAERAGNDRRAADAGRGGGAGRRHAGGDPPEGRADEEGLRRVRWLGVRVRDPGRGGRLALPGRGADFARPRAAELVAGGRGGRLDLNQPQGGFRCLTSETIPGDPSCRWASRCSPPPP